MKFSKQILAFRLRSLVSLVESHICVSDADIAALAGISRWTFSRIMTGVCEPTSSSVWNILDACVSLFEDHRYLVPPVWLHAFEEYRNHLFDTDYPCDSEIKKASGV